MSPGPSDADWAPQLLRILHLEDNPHDAEYIHAVLQSDHFPCRILRVEDEEEFVKALQAFKPDVVISDFTLPHFDGLRALQRVREVAPELPFLFVSGSIGEEFAVECLRHGARDYLMKDKLARLPAAVRRALDEARLEKERALAENRLQRFAFYDELTGMTNRAYFLQQLQAALERQPEDAEAAPAVVVLGLDDFKTLCDGFGWEAGDGLLQIVAGHIRSEIPAAKVLSRVGGDEFGLLFAGERARDLHAVVEKIRQAFRKPLAWRDQDLYLTVGIGVADAQAGKHSADEMLRDCENALHRAKATGKSGCVFFDPAMHRQTVDFLAAVNDLRRAVENREFCVHYQPLLDLRTGSVAGFEALVRWQHPRRGLVPPLDFIPVAERMQLIAPIGAFVLREACRTAKEWRQGLPQHRGLHMAVNVSSQQFEQTDFSEEVGKVLAEMSLEPEAVKLEITESGFIRNPEGAIDLLHRLRNMGLDLYIDDFGTGYSSLSYLHRFPVQALKIDCSFVSRIGAEGENGSIAAAIIDLAHNLGMQVVAEGIETETQLAFLKARGCDYGQGYLFSRPLTAENAFRFLATSALP